MIDVTRITALNAEYRSAIRQPTARKPGSWYNIVPSGGNTTSVYMYEEIGGMFGVTASDFVNEFAQISTPSINLHINSMGGIVFEGTAIMAAIADHPAQVTGIVDGVAASAASFILMACDKRRIRKQGMMMIHDGQGITAGDERDHVATAGILGKLSDVIADVYASRCGGTAQEWRDRMLAETWFNAQEALDSGLVDEIDDDETPSPEPAMRATYDLSVFTNRVKPIPVVDEPARVIEPSTLVEPVLDGFDTHAFRMALLATELTGA